MIIASKSGALNFINIGVIFLGYCEIGTIFEWLITASICKKYREILVLRRVLFAFAFSALAVAVAGTLLVKQTQDVFYILAASVSLLLVSVIFILSTAVQPIT